MLDPETRRSALLQLGFAAQKVHEATDLATDLGLPPPSYSDYVRLTGLQRRNVAIGLAECVRLGFLERIEINPRHVEYRIPAGRQIVASHRLQQEDQLESLRRYLLSASLDQLESLRLQLESQRLYLLADPAPTPSDSEPLTESVIHPTVNGPARNARQRSGNIQNSPDLVDKYAEASCRAVGDPMSNKRLHLRVWSHAIKQGSNLLLGELGNMVRELEALRKSTDEPQGKLFTYRAQAIFRNHGCEYPFKPTGQSEAEFRAEKQAARTAMSHLDEPTDN